MLSIGDTCKKERFKAFRSTFLPCAFALADTESDHAYSHLVQTLFAVAQQLGHNVGPRSILQWHGDMHKGIEAARRRVAPDSVRLSDHAHVVGATSAAPAGLPGLAEKKLGPNADPKWLQLVLQWARITRHMTRHCFSVIWKCIFEYVGEAGHQSACTALQEQYFFPHTTAAGATMWDAHWRAAPDRIMPGTSAGSAPQESWHMHRLKTLVTTRNQNTIWTRVTIAREGSAFCIPSLG